MDCSVARLVCFLLATPCKNLHQDISCGGGAKQPFLNTRNWVFTSSLDYCNVHQFILNVLSCWSLQFAPCNPPWVSVKKVYYKQLIFFKKNEHGFIKSKSNKSCIFLYNNLLSRHGGARPKALLKSRDIYEQTLYSIQSDIFYKKLQEWWHEEAKRNNHYMAKDFDGEPHKILCWHQFVHYHWWYYWVQYG